MHLSEHSYATVSDAFNDWRQKASLIGDQLRADDPGVRDKSGLIFLEMGAIEEAALRLEAETAREVWQLVLMATCGSGLNADPLDRLIVRAIEACGLPMTEVAGTRRH